MLVARFTMEFIDVLVAYTVAHQVVMLALSIATALVLQFAFRLYRQRCYFKNLPCPPHSFLWGHLKLMGDISAIFPPHCHPQAYYTQIARKYGLKGIFYLDLWPIAPSQIVLSDPELLDMAAITKALPQHQLAEDVLSPITGRNIIAAANGVVWKQLHNAILPAFSWPHIRGVTGVIVDECVLFREALDRRAASGEVFSMEEMGAKLVFDIIARVVFNTSLHAQTTGSSYLEDLREMIHLAEGLTDISVAFNPIAQVTLWWKRRRVLRRLDPSILRKIHERLFLLRQQGITPSRKDPTSILDLMLREQVQTSPEEMGSTKVVKPLTPYNEELLLNNVKALLIGGHGTTTDCLCYIYMLLSESPDVVAKLRKEHASIFSDNFDSTVESLLGAPEKLQSLPYTEAVIKEALRLFPVGFGVRAAPEGTTLKYNGRALPIDNNLVVALNGFDLHYNPEYYPDPNTFRPERWLDPKHEIPRSYFRTFGRGPRACLGQNLAQNELKVILLMTIRDYDFKCVGLKPNKKPKAIYTDLDTVYGDIVFQELGLEAKPRGKMYITVKKRQTC
ncbi:cytochrome P450 [Trichoderma ceciliae]